MMDPTRRQGEDTHAHRDFAEEGGFLCPSEVKYGRPQLAQTSRGVWKYIINMPEHTQTIRMERCLYSILSKTLFANMLHNNWKLM